MNTDIFFYLFECLRLLVFGFLRTAFYPWSFRLTLIQPRSQDPLLPVLRSKRETLENAGHVAPEQN